MPDWHYVIESSSKCRDRLVIGIVGRAPETANPVRRPKLEGSRIKRIIGFNPWEWPTVELVLPPAGGQLNNQMPSHVSESKELQSGSNVHSNILCGA